MASLASDSPRRTKKPDNLKARRAGCHVRQTSVGDATGVLSPYAEPPMSYAIHDRRGLVGMAPTAGQLVIVAAAPGARQA